MSYVIDTGIPVPEFGSGRKCTYPWKQLEVGQSFFVEKPTKNFTSLVSAASKRYGCRFVHCRVDGGIRVWRAA